MSRGTDLITVMDNVTLIAGANASDVFEVRGPSMFVYVSALSSASLAINLEFAETDSGPTWHPLQNHQSPGSNLGPSTIATADAPCCYAVSAWSTGESFGIAGPYARLSVTGSVSDTITALVGFSGPMR